MADKQRWQDEPFGDDEEGWNLDNSGNIGVMTFANAVQVWSMFQDRPQTIEDAAKAFNCSSTKIAAAVKAHPWMFLNGDTIEHEGE